MNALNEVIQIKVNESRLISNLGSVFSNNTKVLAELMQNARRAGASQIRVIQDVESDCIIVSDDGQGIHDFQKLLTLADSGWDQEIMVEEGPYGMGFFSALFSARKVIVRSMGKQIIVHGDQDLLSQKIDITPSDVQSGTTVLLYGTKIENLENELKLYAMGFAVDVFFNDSTQPLPSPHRLDDSFVQFGAGQIRAKLDNIAKSYHGQAAHNYVAYLQGFVVASNYGSYLRRSEELATVIHLDSTFKARMPDRDCLINASVQCNRIADALKQYWAGQLLSLKQTNPDKLFEHYDLLSELKMLDLFNDIDYLPGNFLGTLTLPLKNSCNGDSCYVKTFAGSERIVSKNLADRLVLQGDPVAVDNSDHPYAMAMQMAIHQSGMWILNHDLDPGHWVYQRTRLMPDLLEEEFEFDKTDTNNLPVQVSHPKPSKSGKWGGFDVLLVDYYELSVPSLGIKVRVNSQLGLALGCDDCGGWEPAILLMPPDSDADVLDQGNNWIDGNDNYDDRWASDEKRSLDAYLRVLRGHDQAAVLSDLLKDTDVIIRQALANQKFSVTFDENGRAIVEHDSNIVC